MIRNGFLAALVALGLANFSSAGELDRERSGSAPASASAVTFKGSGDVLGVTTSSSELDGESPTQACHWRGGYGVRYASFYGGGWGGGFGYSSYYGGGWGGYPAYGYSSYYRSGYGGFGGYPVYNVGYGYRSYYGGGWGGRCGW